jgi:hypothetical protein
VVAVTRDGIPVRCWTFPGNESDQRIIRTIKDDLAGWNLHRLVWVADRGFASAWSTTSPPGTSTRRSTWARRHFTPTLRS